MTGNIQETWKSDIRRGSLRRDAAGAMNCAEGFFEWMHSQQTVTREDIEIKILEMVMNAERRAFFAGTEI